MRTLQIPFDPFRTEHPAIERELFPRLKPNDFVVFDFQLNAALLSAEAAMRAHLTIRLDAPIQPRAAGKGQMRTEVLK